MYCELLLLQNTLLNSAHPFQGYVNLPPALDIVLCCILCGVSARIEDDSIHLRQVAMLPRLDRANEVDDLDITTESAQRKTSELAEEGGELRMVPKLRILYSETSTIKQPHL